MMTYEEKKALKKVIKERTDEDEHYIYEALDRAGITEEKASKSYKMYQMRYILIYKYAYGMLREEICALINEPSLRTYTNRLNEGLRKIRKYI